MQRSFPYILVGLLTTTPLIHQPARSNERRGNGVEGGGLRTVDQFKGSQYQMKGLENLQNLF